MLADCAINVVTHVRGLLIRFIHRPADSLNVIAVVQRLSVSLETSCSDTSSFFCLLGTCSSLQFSLRIVVSVAVPKSSFEEE